MSVDYAIYFKSSDGYSLKDCNAYFLFQPLKAQLHPEFDLKNDTGFLPIRFSGEGIDPALKGREFLSGFECYWDEYQYEPPSAPKQTFWQKLLGKRSPGEETPEKDCKESLTLCCSGELTESLLACLFGVYFLRNFGGIFEDMQTGERYTDPRSLEETAEEFLKEAGAEYQRGELQLHAFEGWS